MCVPVAFKQVILAFRPSCRFPKAVSDAKMVCCQKKKPRPITSLSGPLFDDRDCREVEGRRAGLKKTGAFKIDRNLIDVERCQVT